MTSIFSNVCIAAFAKKLVPVDAIVLTDISDYHFENRGEQIMTKDKLLAIGDQYESEIAKNRTEEKTYR